MTRSRSSAKAAACPSAEKASAASAGSLSLFDGVETDPLAVFRTHPGPVAGVDEAGRGCLAGPVVAAAVILPGDLDPALLPGLTDSKKLTAAKREKLAPLIREHAAAWSLGVAWPREIDATDILRATLRCMATAVTSLKISPSLAAIDGNQTVPDLLCEQRTVIDGDSLVPAISAASILAKTFRDMLMVKFDRRYPGYDFAGHKGYGTKVHREAIAALGACPLHRMTFRGVLPEEGRQAALAAKPARRGGPTREECQCRLLI